MCFRCVGSKKSSNCEDRLSSSPPPAPRVVGAIAESSATGAQQSRISATLSSVASSSSVDSTATVDSIQSNQSLQTLARQISSDIESVKGRSTNLKVWANSLDPDGQRKWIKPTTNTRGLARFMSKPKKNLQIIRYYI